MSTLLEQHSCPQSVPTCLNISTEFNAMISNTFVQVCLTVKKCCSWGHFNWYGLALILTCTCISNHMPSKVWKEITYSFPTFNGFIVEAWEWMNNFISVYDVCNYLPLLGSKLIHVSKSGPRLAFGCSLMSVSRDSAWEGYQLRIVIENI